MRILIALLALVPIVTHAGTPARDAPPPKCLELPPDVRQAWHLKPTDCPHAVTVARMCDVTPPDVAKLLKIDVSHCPKGSTGNP